MSQYKISLHDCSKDPDNFNVFPPKFRTVFWRDEKTVGMGRLVRKRITTKTVLEVFKFWDSVKIVDSPDWKDYLRRTQIKEYEPV